jgi:hypothetical protein
MQGHPKNSKVRAIDLLVDEGADIPKNKRATREEEINWRSSLITRVE